MLHILLTILKILGILLLVLLGLLLVLLLSVLFVPVCYGAQGRKNDDGIYGKLSVSWLFRLIYARFVYENQKTALEIFVFGIPLLAAKRKMAAWKAERREKKAKKQEEKQQAEKQQATKQAVKQVKKQENQTAADAGDRRKKETADPESQREKTEADTERQGEKTEADTESQREKMEADPEKISVLKRAGGMISGIGRRIKGIFTALWGLPGKIAERIRKIRLTFRGICDKIKQWYTFLQMEDTKQALRFLKDKGKGLLRHILPRKVRGNVVFGFDDPSLTGQILAVAGAVYPLYKERLQLTPVFDRQVLEGEVKLSGRVYGGYLLLQAWQIYRNREVKVTYRRFQHKEA